MSIKILILTAFLIVQALAQEHLAPVPVKPQGSIATIAPDLEIAYWRSLVDDLRAQLVQLKTGEASSRNAEAIVKACGPGAFPQDDLDASGKPKGRLICVPAKK